MQKIKMYWHILHMWLHVKRTHFAIYIEVKIIRPPGTVVPGGLTFCCGLFIFLWHFAALYLRDALADRPEIFTHDKAPSELLVNLFVRSSYWSVIRSPAIKPKLLLLRSVVDCRMHAVQIIHTLRRREEERLERTEMRMLRSLDPWSYPEGQEKE